VCPFVVPCFRSLFESLSVDCIVTGTVKEAIWERFGDDLVAIWGSFGVHVGVIRMLFGSSLGNSGSWREPYRFLSIFGVHFGRLLGTLLETILHLGGHVWRFSR